MLRLWIFGFSVGFKGLSCLSKCGLGSSESKQAGQARGILWDPRLFKRICPKTILKLSWPPISVLSRQRVGFECVPTNTASFCAGAGIPLLGYRSGMLLQTKPRLLVEVVVMK